jgi:hypothetical protein
MWSWQERIQKIISKISFRCCMICCCCCSTAVVAAGVTVMVTVTATTTVTGAAAAGGTAAAGEGGPAAVPAAPAAVTREGEQLVFTIEGLLKRILKLNIETGLVLLALYLPAIQSCKQSQHDYLHSMENYHR